MLFSREEPIGFHLDFIFLSYPVWVESTLGLCHPLFCTTVIECGSDDEECRAMKVLVIEDDAGSGKLVRRGLEDAAYQVDVAFDGATRLNMALENTYVAIVLDVMLPKLDGWRVCEELRLHRSRTPILMLTARRCKQ
jgi:PleD family two-component response regulator